MGEFGCITRTEYAPVCNRKKPDRPGVGNLGMKDKRLATGTELGIHNLHAILMASLPKQVPGAEHHEKV